MANRSILSYLACSFLSFILPLLTSSFLANAEEYQAFGTLELALKPTDKSIVGPSGIYAWLGFGDWRNNVGINGPSDIEYKVTVDRSTNLVRIYGTLDGHLRDHVTFASLGKIRGEVSYVLSNVFFNSDPSTKLSVFAIGRNSNSQRTSGAGTLKITSPDGSVNLGPTGSITIVLTDKYRMSGAPSDPYYGPFIGDPFDVYIGQSYKDPNPWFTGSNGRGLAAWLMFDQAFAINGIQFSGVTGGDFHGDLIPVNQAPLCSVLVEGAASFSPKCSGTTSSVMLDGSKSVDTDGLPMPLKYSWNSTCPNANFDDATSIAPKMSFLTQNGDGTPAACMVTLTVSDGALDTSCSLPVNVQPCLYDCKNILNGSAALDRCGVCEGDGNSCLGCSNLDVRSSILALDSGTQKLSAMAKKVAARIRRARGSNTSKELKLVADAHALYLETWREVNSIPSKFTKCTNTQFCVEISFISILNSYSSKSSEILDIINILLKSYGRSLRAKGISATNVNKSIDRLRVKASDQAIANQKEASSVPNSSSACS